MLRTEFNPYIPVTIPTIVPTSKLHIGTGDPSAEQMYFAMDAEQISETIGSNTSTPPFDAWRSKSKGKTQSRQG
jgi:hypothetical protein